MVGEGGDASERQGRCSESLRLVDDRPHLVSWRLGGSGLRFYFAVNIVVGRNVNTGDRLPVTQTPLDRLAISAGRGHPSKVVDVAVQGFGDECAETPRFPVSGDSPVDAANGTKHDGEAIKAILISRRTDTDGLPEAHSSAP